MHANTYSHGQEYAYEARSTYTHTLINMCIYMYRQAQGQQLVCSLYAVAVFNTHARSQSHAPSLNGFSETLQSYTT